MENVEFDYEKIAQMKLDNTILDCSTKILSEASGGNKNVLISDKMIRVFINKGIPLSIALDIITDILDILTEIGGENHG